MILGRKVANLNNKTYIFYSLLLLLLLLLLLFLLLLSRFYEMYLRNYKILNDRYD